MTLGVNYVISTYWLNAESHNRRTGYVLRKIVDLGNNLQEMIIR